MKLSYLGIMKAKEHQFNRKGIYTVEDLVRFLPRKYNDFSRETGILPEDQTSCLIATVTRVNSYHNGTPMMIAFCTIQPTGEKLLVKWFRQNYMLNKISACVGRDVYICAKLVYDEKYKNYSATMPELFEPKISEGKRILPVYPKIPGMSAEYLTEKMQAAVGIPEATSETCPYDLVAEEKLLPIQKALYYLHFPKTMEQIQQGQDRMLFDDLLYFALNNEYASRNSAIGSTFSVKTLGAVNRIVESLPYKLTADQKAAIDSMIEDARSGKRINALVQGDVGCGKTIVAFLLMAAFADSGYQAVLMAPTQVLARQHYEDLKALVEPLGFKAVYLGGAEMKAKEKKAVLAAIESGEANFVVGTHAIISKNVTYHNLAITVADEEHKFGVAQRTALIEKAAAGVHSITMSATPIPRTLAQVIYGTAVQLYTIVTMPEGRKPVITGIATDENKVFRFILKETKRGHQTYVVCPMIDPSDDVEGVQSVEEVSSIYLKALGPYGVRIATLTGRNSKTETEQIISDFKDGKIDVLIATTVIEVGVNVPNATTMVVTNAERFGLSSLHQLRGRVGRSNLQSYCVLQSNDQTEKGRMRLDAMVRTTNGFEIAEEDLKIRGAGDFLGTRQSGENKYMALMLAYPEKYKYAQEIAKRILDDGKPCRMLARVKSEQEAGASNI